MKWQVQWICYGFFIVSVFFASLFILGVFFYGWLWFKPNHSQLEMEIDAQFDAS